MKRPANDHNSMVRRRQPTATCRKEEGRTRHGERHANALEAGVCSEVSLTKWMRDLVALLCLLHVLKQA